MHMTYGEAIAALREEIKLLDVEIVDKLSRRVGVALKIGEVKSRYGKPVVDEDRESRIYKSIRELATCRSVDPEGVARIYREIVKLCTEAQQEEMV